MGQQVASAQKREGGDHLGGGPRPAITANCQDLTVNCEYLTVECGQVPVGYQRAGVGEYGGWLIGCENRTK